jgi:flagellar hook-associated protein 3 FlgL
MRVASHSFTDTFINQLNALAARQQQLQTQAATGQRVRLPEDDPAAVQRTLVLRSDSKTLQQYRRNISNLQERASASIDAIKSLKKVSDRASEIATLADGTKSADELRIYASQVTQLIQQAAQFMNTKLRGDYIFSGTAIDQPPFVVTTDADGRVTAVDYQGNSNVSEVEIEQGVTLSIDVPGVNNTGSGTRGLVVDTQSGADFFKHLISLQNHLSNGDTTSIASTDIPALRLDEENLIYHIGSNGAAQARLETEDSLLSNHLLSLEGLISKEVDADLTETLVKLNQSQYSYQAALQSGAKILQLSLLDFL